MRKTRTAKSTIGQDPFGAVIPAPVAEPARPAGRPRTGSHAPLETVERTAPATDPVATAHRAAPGTLEPPPVPARAARAPTRKQKLTVHLDDELLNRVKNAAYWNPRLTIARIAERGIRQAIAQVEKENGGPYPQRESELIGGRPMK